MSVMLTGDQHQRQMSRSSHPNESHAIFSRDGDQNPPLGLVAAQIQSLTQERQTQSSNVAFCGGSGDAIDPFAVHCDNSSESIDDLSPQQRQVWDQVFSGTYQNGRHTQVLTLAHGGGGTGKSYVIRKIARHIERRGFKVVSTCPTGAGACQMNNGHTFHSAMKCAWGRSISMQATETLKEMFDARVALIIVDEVSMLGAEMLALLNERLQLVYNNTMPFGGISILLVSNDNDARPIHRNILTIVRVCRSAIFCNCQRSTLCRSARLYTLRQKTRSCCQVVRYFECFASSFSTHNNVLEAANVSKIN